MTLLGLAFDPVQCRLTIPEAAIRDQFANSFSVDLDNVSHIEDLVILSAGVGERAPLDEEVSVLFNTHSSASVRCRLVRGYPIQSMGVERFCVGEGSF